MGQKIPDLKSKILNLLKIIGFGLNEIIIDLDIDEITFNSIEFDKETSEIFLHLFVSDLDYTYNFDDLEYNNQLKIWEILSVMYN